VPRESSDARDDLPKEGRCQVGFGKLEDFRELRSAADADPTTRSVPSRRRPWRCSGRCDRQGNRAV